MMNRCFSMTERAVRLYIGCRLEKQDHTYATAGFENWRFPLAEEERRHTGRATEQNGGNDSAAHNPHQLIHITYIGHKQHMLLRQCLLVQIPA